MGRVERSSARRNSRHNLIMAYDAYVLLKGNIYTKIVGVTAESKELAVDNYDNSVWRKEYSANYLGRAWWGAAVQSRSQITSVPAFAGQVLRGAGATPGQVLNGADTRTIANNTGPASIGFPINGSVAAQTNPTASAGRAAQTVGTAPTASAISSPLVDAEIAADSSVEVTDDRFTRTAPRYTLKKRSRYVWTITGGTVWAWADEIRCVSPAPFGFASQALPASYTNP